MVEAQIRVMHISQGTPNIAGSCWKLEERHGINSPLAFPEGIPIPMVSRRKSYQYQYLDFGLPVHFINCEMCEPLRLRK